MSIMETKMMDPKGPGHTQASKLHQDEVHLGVNIRYNRETC